MRLDYTNVKVLRIFKVFSLAVIYSSLLFLALCAWGCFFMIKFGMDYVFSFAFSFAFFSIIFAGFFSMLFSRVEEIFRGPEWKLDIVGFISRMENFIYRICYLVMILVITLSVGIGKSEFQYIFCAALMCISVILSMKPVFGLIRKSEVKEEEERKSGLF